MKNITLSLAAFLIACFGIVAGTFAQTRPAQPGLGIIAITDEITHLNYNQLFKMVVQDNPATLNKAALTVDLVEHQAQANVAVSVKIEDARALVSFYKSGQPAGKDTIRLPKMETKRPYNGINLPILAGTAGIVVGNLTANEPEYKRGIRPGDIVLEMNGSAMSADKLNHALAILNDSLRVPTVSIKIQQSETGEMKHYTLKRRPMSQPFWARPLQVDQLEEIFSEVLLSMAWEHANRLGIQFKNVPDFRMKAMSNAKNKADDGKCRSYELMPTCYDSEMHVLAPDVSLVEIFRSERFFVPKNKKIMPAGDAALNALRYYNLDQRKTYVSENDHVSDNVKTAIQKLNGPFYRMPGVFANYLAAGQQYEKAGNFPAALNQYYGSYFQIDNMLAGELAKVRAKKVVLARIAHCSKQLEQVGYAGLTNLAKDCLNHLIFDSKLNAQDRNFYDFSGKTLQLSRGIEEQLAKQRSEKFFAVAGAVLSAGAGVATLSMDLDISTSLFQQSFNILDDNAQLNYQINSALSETTRSIQINLPAELQEEDENPCELILTAAINYCLERAENKTTILSLIAEYAAGKPALYQSVDVLRKQYQISETNLDVSALVAELIKTERAVYRYEKRGLQLPATVSVP